MLLSVVDKRNSLPIYFCLTQSVLRSKTWTKKLSTAFQSVRWEIEGIVLTHRIVLQTTANSSVLFTCPSELNESNHVGRWSRDLVEGKWMFQDRNLLCNSFEYGYCTCFEVIACTVWLLARALPLLLNSIGRLDLTIWIKKIIEELHEVTK